MWDLIVIGIVAGFLIATIAYLLGCEWLNPAAAGKDGRK
jgi:hypothetical protein